MNFSSKVLHTYNLPNQAVDPTKEYPHPLRFKDAYFYILRNLLPSSLLAQRRVRTDARDFIVNNDSIFHINLQERLANVTPNILLAIMEMFEPVILHTLQN